MKNVKVLQLDWWMRYDFESGELQNDYHSAKTYYEVFPEFNREGVYLNDQRCWFEIGGKAFKYSRIDFEFQLQMLNVKPLRKVEYEAYKILRKAKLLSRKEKEKLSIYEDWLRLEEVGRDSAKCAVRATKMFEEFKKKKGL